jgi:hypothetical protein
MAIIGVRTELNVSIEAKNTPKTGLIQTTDNGNGVAESHLDTRFGSELVANGDLPTATTSWSAFNSVLSIDTARLKITNSGANKGYAHQAITTVVGKTYRLEYDVTIGDAVSANIFVGAAIGGDELGRKINVTGDGSLVFVASSTSTKIHLQNNSAVSSEFNFYDNISVKLTNGSLHFGRATDGVKANERLIKQALNTRIT